MPIMHPLTREWLFDPSVSGIEKHRACRAWLDDFERTNLPSLRTLRFAKSALDDQVTLIAYAFYENPEDFFSIEFSILHTWRVLGQLPVVLVVDRITPVLKEFQMRHAAFVRMAVSPTLKAGYGYSMSIDCVRNLHRHFDTPHCLIVQNDGFPLRNGLDEFVGKYDYIGAPAVLDSWKQGLADLCLCDVLNGGFCLRSHRCCEEAARIGANFCFETPDLILEDEFYCRILRRNPLRRMRLKFPWAWEARKFSIIDIYGTIDCSKLKSLPLGAHGPTTLFQYQDTLCSMFGYRPPSQNMV